VNAILGSIRGRMRDGSNSTPRMFSSSESAL
jgi:hypothetical protein